MWKMPPMGRCLLSRHAASLISSCNFAHHAVTALQKAVQHLQEPTAAALRLVQLQNAVQQCRALELQHMYTAPHCLPGAPTAAWPVPLTLQHYRASTALYSLEDPRAAQQQLRATTWPPQQLCSLHESAASFRSLQRHHNKPTVCVQQSRFPFAFLPFGSAKQQLLSRGPTVSSMRMPGCQPTQGLQQQQIAAFSSCPNLGSSSSSSNRSSSSTNHSRDGVKLESPGSRNNTNSSSKGPKLGSIHSSSADARVKHQGTDQLPSEQLPPKVLTSLIKHSKSLQQLQQLLDQYSHQLNYIHVAAAVVHLPKLVLFEQPQVATAKGLQLLEQLWQPLQQQLSQYGPRELANIIHALLSKTSAAIRQQYQDAVMQQLVPALLQQLETATPQAVGNVLYSVAVSGQQLSLVQTQLLAFTLASKTPLASPQDISNCLWAVATMHQELPGHLLQQLLDAFSCKLHEAQSQAVSNTLWACGCWNYLPEELMLNPLLLTKLQAAKPQELANTAWACGQLGHRDEQLMGVVVQQLQRLLAANSTEVTLQVPVNVAWAIAMLDMQNYAPAVAMLVQECVAVRWDRMSADFLRQLYQAHWWLVDIKYGSSSRPGQGLLGVLTAEQLQQCKAAWEAQIHHITKTVNVSSTQQSVLKAVRQLPTKLWQQGLQMEQLSKDGLLLIDILGVTASGQLVAVEVDGPHHFVLPGNTLTGPTQWRNRALASRGCTVISVPYFKWDAVCGNSRQRQQYLLHMFRAAGVS